MFQYIDEEYCVLGDTLLSWTGNKNCIHLPSVIGGQNIRHIGKGCFLGNKNITEVFIGEGYESIGEQAFAKCEKLVKVVMPDSVKVIDDSAFNTCIVMKAIRISHNLEKLGDRALFGCNKLVELHLPSNIKEVPKSVTESYSHGAGEGFFLHFKVSAAEFSELAKCSIRLSDGRRLLSEGAESLSWLSTIKGFNIPVHISEDMKSIFLINNPKVDFADSLKRDVLSWEEVPSKSTENTVINKRIKDGSYVYCGKDEEETWAITSISGDERLPYGFRRSDYLTYFCVLDSVNRLQGGSVVEGRIRVIRQYGFYISVRRVVYEGKEYYIYTINYLAGRYMPKGNKVGASPLVYYRDDIAVVYNGFVLPDKKLSEEVYAKYKLFSIL